MPQRRHGGDLDAGTQLLERTLPAADSSSWQSNREESSNGLMDLDEEDETNPGASNDKGKSFGQKIWLWISKETLLVFTLIGVVLGIALGSILLAVNASNRVIEFVGLPGELFMHALKMLILPLISASMVSGVCSLRQTGGQMGKVARITLSYYLVTTAAAVTIGIALVSLIKPGTYAQGTKLDCDNADIVPSSNNDDTTPTDAMLNVVKALVPPNIVKAAADLNILGIITFSILFGLALSSLNDSKAKALIELVDAFNNTITKMVMWILWTSPIGICSLIACTLGASCNLSKILEALGVYVGVYLIGLIIHGGVVLPLSVYLPTGRQVSPWRVLRTFLPTFVTVIGTDSSSASLPVTMKCAREYGCSEPIIQFVLPLGATINMNGTALYEALTVIFIAQMHGEDLSVGRTLAIALTATLAAVGAAAIPSAGLVTMVMVLQAANLGQYSNDIALVFTLDWLLDRLRTVVNVEGDAFGVVLTDYFFSKRRRQAAYEDIDEVADEYLPTTVA